MSTQPKTEKLPNTKAMAILLANITIISVILGLAFWKISEIKAQAGQEIEQYKTLAESAVKDREQLQKIALALGVNMLSNDLASLTEATIRERNTLKKTNADLSHKYKIISNSHADLKLKHKQVAAEKSEFEKKTRNAVNKHSQSVSTRLLRSSKRQVVTAPGKSIPFYGVAFIAGLTALDVYEACETIREINELNVAIGTQPEIESTNKICGLKAPNYEQLSTQINSNWQAAYSVAAEAANRAGKPFAVKPPNIDASQLSNRVCAIFKVPGFCP